MIPMLPPSRSPSFRETDGDLAQVSAALVNEPEAREPFHKYKSPYEYVVPLRALKRDRRRAKVHRSLGQIPFTAPSPAGWSDDKPTGSRRNPLGHVSIGSVWATPTW